MTEPQDIAAETGSARAENTGAEKKKTAARKTAKAPAQKKDVESAVDSVKKPKAAAKSTTGHTAKKVEAAPVADATEKKTAGRTGKQSGKTTAAKKTSKSKGADIPASSSTPSSAGSARSGRKKSAAKQPDVGQDVSAADTVVAANASVEVAPAEKKSSARSRGGRKKAVEKAAAPDHAPAEDAGSEDGADGFVDTEEATVVVADADEGVTETCEKKRRSRSRRGRGRKKTAAHQAAEHEKNGEYELPIVFVDLPEEADEEEDGNGHGKDSSAHKDSDVKATGKTPRRKMFVSVLPEEQIEVVLTEEGQVQEYYVEMLHQAKTKGNIYKGIVHNVDSNLQAAFVSYGAVKNGFLQIDEVHPEYYVSPHDAAKGRKYPPIQKVLKAGQELLVQIVKEPSGTKGAFLTTYLSMPGRFLVLTPGREQIGVSRKVENETERARLRELLEGLSPGPGLGVIVRTVSMGASKTSLQRDLQYLKRAWKDARARGTTEKAPSLIYQEMDLTSRAVRDYLTEAVGEVWIDDEPTATAVTEIAEALFPRKKNLVRVHKDTSATLFERFNIQRQLDQIQSREVTLPSGGRLVIDATEALTAIDINSGRSGGKNNFEDMAFRTNMEAARMIPLQLRLRDIGGQIVADFIEMRDRSHWREVEKTLRSGMKVDRARHDVGKIGPFGMLEIVRQRLGSSAISISSEACPCCGGTGVRRNMEWQSQHALRDILRLLRNAQAQNESAISYSVEQPLALHLLNHKRQRVLEMEQQYGARVDILIKAQEVV